MQMVAHLQSPQGWVIAYYDDEDVSEARLFWPRERWWHHFQRLRPIEDARLVMWCREYLRITKQRELDLRAS